MPDKTRFLVHAVRGTPLTDFLTLAATDPEIAVVDVIGPRDRPHTAVLELSPDKARLLDQHFRLSGTLTHQLTIEQDRPLSMFSDPPNPF